MDGRKIDFLINYGTVMSSQEKRAAPTHVCGPALYPRSDQPSSFSRITRCRLRRPDLTFGTFDHNVPTVNIYDIRDVISKARIDKLAENVEEFGLEHAAYGSEKQGIVHMVGPETGRTQPGKFIVCGDSHTATHGAFRRSPLELGPVRSSMSLQPRPYGRSNPRKCW